MTILSIVCKFKLLHVKRRVCQRKNREHSPTMSVNNNGPFFGRYACIREQLDYTFHKRYSKERQLFQDQIVYDAIDEKKEFCRKKLFVTAGAMGAGKTHTVKRFLGTFYNHYVVADVDKIKHCLPEMKELLATNPKNAGHILHSEACTIHEIIFRDAIQERKNVIIDGSLRNGDFFVPLFKTWQSQGYEITIVHVIASLATCVRRATKRAKMTGRYIPEESIRKSLQECPISVQKLTPFVNHVVTIYNDMDDD